MTRTLCLFSAFMMICSCDTYPKDTTGTSDHIKESRRLDVGVVAGTNDWSAAREIVDELAEEFGATVNLKTMPAEVALRQLDDGNLDLFVGEFGRSSPLSEVASLSQTIGQPEPQNGKVPSLRLVRKNGENAFITKTDKMVLR